MNVKRKYCSGQIFCDREIFGYELGSYLMKCLRCGKIAHVPASFVEHRRCFCIMDRPAFLGPQRFSGRSYKNSPQRIAEIKRKYANGVTPEIMKELEDKLSGAPF